MTKCRQNTICVEWNVFFENSALSVVTLSSFLSISSPLSSLFLATSYFTMGILIYSEHWKVTFFKQEPFHGKWHWSCQKTVYRLSELPFQNCSNSAGCSWTHCCWCGLSSVGSIRKTLWPTAEVVLKSWSITLTGSREGTWGSADLGSSLGDGYFTINGWYV